MMQLRILVLAGMELLVQHRILQLNMASIWGLVATGIIPLGLNGMAKNVILSMASGFVLPPGGTRGTGGVIGPGIL